MAPWTERRQNVQAYYKSSRSQNTFSDSVVQRVSEELFERPARLRPKSAEEVIPLMTTDTNSGLPRFRRRSTVVPESIEDAANIFEGVNTYPAILGWRGQSGGPEVGDVKQRTVWMFPFGTNIAEYRYYHPVFETIRQKSFGSAWSDQDAINLAVDRFLRDGGNTSLKLSIDFSGYDQSVAPEHQSRFWDVMRFAFQEPEGLEELATAFQTIQIICTRSVMLSGSHGVPSGSVFTNLCDTVIHRMLQYHCAEKFGDKINLSTAQCQGDDGLLSYEGLSTAEVVDCLSELGFEANLDKQFIGSDDCVYLQRYYHRNYERGVVGIYPTFRALNSLMGQERVHDPEKWGIDMVILRSIMILENTKYHPLFREFVSFVRESDRYGLDPSRINQETIAKAKSISGLVPQYNQERRIHSFELVDTVDTTLLVVLGN